MPHWLISYQALINSMCQAISQALSMAGSQHYSTGTTLGIEGPLLERAIVNRTKKCS